MASMRSRFSAFNNSPWLSASMISVIWLIAGCFSSHSVWTCLLILPWLAAEGLELVIHDKQQSNLRHLQDMQKTLGNSLSPLGQLPSELIKPHTDLWVFLAGTIAGAASIFIFPGDQVKDGGYLGVCGVMVVWKLSFLHFRYQRNTSILREEMTRLQTGIQNLIDARRSAT